MIPHKRGAQHEDPGAPGGLAVCFALTSTCTSLSLVYSSLGGQKERPPQRQRAAATGSARRSTESSPLPRPEAPARPRPLHGYLGVADKEDLQHLAQHWLVPKDDGPGALRQDQCLWHGAPRLTAGIPITLEYLLTITNLLDRMSVQCTSPVSEDGRGVITALSQGNEPLRTGHRHSIFTFFNQTGNQNRLLEVILRINLCSEEGV
ncbi:hypothetical protein J1605_009670 [Eschrichtius robustus]|uniref:Uncharacterized protein n=1 Tax=Eschrichtius robustus TaxID=9764 RepID=A0AB34GRC7_ESCRO|nr:hypothetical protein J1605_009670 [Eschrichtius robustus]